MQKPEEKTKVIEGRVNGRFAPGVSGNPRGRARGSRNKLATNFLDDLFEKWEEHGKRALDLCALREPTQFCKIVKDVLPREVLLTSLNLNASIDFSDAEDAKAFLRAFRRCQEEKVIEHQPLDHIEEGSPVSDGWKHNDDD